MEISIDVLGRCCLLLLWLDGLCHEVDIVQSRSGLFHHAMLPEAVRPSSCLGFRLADNADVEADVAVPMGYGDGVAGLAFLW